MGTVASKKTLATRIRAWAAAVACSIGLAVVAMSAAQAQTTVGGVIAANTTWSAAQGPYIVSSDITVQSGAVLTIEAGTTIYMGAGRSLAVQGGGIQAVGTPTAMITITSDKLRTGAPAAPGDWRTLTFASGTVNTRLEYVTVEYGEGLVVSGSSPTFNYLDVRNHAGPAIRIDLAASPSGVGNVASGNQQNAILVPAGDIAGNVTWGLRGIPYLVASGTVSVGASPAIAALVPTSIEQGETKTVTVSGTRLSGAASARFSTAGLTAQIVPGGSATQLQLSVSATEAAELGQAELTLLVDAGKAKRSAALNVIGPQFKLTSVSPATVFVGQGPVELDLAGSRFTSAAVALANGVALPTTFVNSARLRATLPNQAATGVLAIAVRQPDPANPSEFLVSADVPVAAATPSLALAPATATFIRGTTQDLTLTLPYPAQTGGQTINLVSSVPGVASVPATVSIAEGGSSASVPVTTLSNGSTTITASRTGFTSAQSVVTVVPPPTLTITPPSLTIGVGRTATLTITSSTVAGTGGIALTLSSSASDVASVPTTALIPSGASSTTVTLTTASIGNATISAAASGHVAGAAAVTVRPVSINFPSGALVAPGLSRSVPLTLSDPAPTGGLLVSLSSSNPAVVTVPSQITVPQGQSAANITITGVAVGSATITAAANGYEAGTLPVTVDAVNISLGTTSTSLPASVTHLYTLTISRPAPVGGVSVSLATGNSAIATVAPSVIEIPEGQTSGGVIKVALTGVAAGSTTLSASAPGLNTANVAVNVTPQPAIVFNRTSVPVGKGLQTYNFELYAQLRSGSNVYNPPNGTTISLSSSDPSKVTLPSTLTFTPNDGTAYFRVVGVELTGATPVTIDAAGTGFTAPVTKLGVNVVVPQLNWQLIDTPRSPAGQRDNVRLFVSVPGASYTQDQYAVADLPIDLAIVDETPGEVVDGFYPSASGGTLITQTSLRAGISFTDQFYVGVPSAAGSYRLQANMANGATTTSGVVTVSSPELRFSKTSLPVGKGLLTYNFEVYVYRAVNGTAFNGALPVVVNLTSSDPTRATVPATVTIPANTDNAYFRVTGVDLTGGTPVTIDATASGYTAPATKLAVSVVNPTLNLQSLDNPRSPASQRDNFRVNFTVPGASYTQDQYAVADMPIDLAITAPSPADIIDGFYSAATAGTPIAQLVMRAGNSFSDFAYVGVPTAAGSYRVQASLAGGSTTTSGVITVSPPELRFSKTSVPVGKGLLTYNFEVYVYRAVNGQAFNGTSPVVVNLTSSDPTRATMPATVTIPANTDNAYFRVTGVDLTGGTPVTIDATASGYTAPATKLAVNVVNPTVNLQSLDDPRSPAGQRDNFRVHLTVPGASYTQDQYAVADMPIDVAIVEPSPAGIVDGFYSAATDGTAVTQTLLRAGNSFSDFIYVGVPTVAGSYRVQASVGGSIGTSGAITVTAPELRFSRSSLIAGAGLRTYQFEVYVYRAVNGNAFNGTAPVTVNLSCSSTAICNVPASVTIPANADSVYFPVTGVGVGTTTITATAVGYNSVQDLNVSVISPSLRFSGVATSLTVGQSDTFTVGTTVPGSTYTQDHSAVAPITINLTSSAPDVGTVTPQVAIAAGAVSLGNATFTTQGAGSTTVTASHVGAQPASISVTVNP